MIGELVMDIIGGFLTPSPTSPPTNRERRIVGFVALVSVACGVWAWLAGATFLAVVLGGLGLFVLLVLAAAWGLERLQWRFM